MSISILNLSHTYRHGIRALKNIDLEIGGGIFGLLGPNGAGKTTLMHILATLLQPTESEVSIYGYDLRRNRSEIRALLGYLPQNLGVFPKLKVWEFLDYIACLSGIVEKSERIRMVDSLLDLVSLGLAHDMFCNELSGGMKRRLGIAQVLIGCPGLLVIDEPTAGLDPEERLRFRSLLSELGGKKLTIVLSTHIVGDISSVCTDMAMLDKGEIVFRGSPAELIELTRGHAWTVILPGDHLDDLKSRYPVIAALPSGDSYEVQIVAEHLGEYHGTPLEPNLEHAYVYFHEFVLGRR